MALSAKRFSIPTFDHDYFCIYKTNVVVATANVKI